MTKRTKHLLIIDPQNDFCDLPHAYCPKLQDGRVLRPSLPVPGAHADMLRVASLIKKAGRGLTDISITLDSHHHNDIAHPSFWVKADEEKLTPFTEIKAQDVKEGRYLPRMTEALNRVVQYLEALEKNNRYIHMVWPVHCEIGSWGNNVHIDVLEAYNRWEEEQAKGVNKILKGMNPWTEHYSAIEAEVPDFSDLSTCRNDEFISLLSCADALYVAGEASSHCVKSTIEHLALAMNDKNLEKIALLSDCMSPVKGFENDALSFLNAMQQKGMRVIKSVDALTEIQANQ